MVQAGVYVMLLITQDPITEGFSYHEKIPLISRELINPVTGYVLSPLESSIPSTSMNNNRAKSKDTSAQAESVHCPPFNVSWALNSLRTVRLFHSY